MDPRGKKYPGNGIDVYYDAAICIHAARCVDGLPRVFDPKARPWIQPMNGAADELAQVIERCPTGALHHVRHDGGRTETPASKDSVTMVARGPLYVRGDVTVATIDGTFVRQETRMALCRCGHSHNKPFCDNSHIEAKFEG